MLSIIVILKTNVINTYSINQIIQIDSVGGVTRFIHIVKYKVSHETR